MRKLIFLGILLFSSNLYAQSWIDIAEQTVNSSHSQQEIYSRANYYNLTNNRGIPLYTLIGQENGDQYNSIDPSPQSHSIALFLIQKKGRKTFIDCLRELKMNRLERRYNRVFNKYYGFNDLNDLHFAWLGWLKTNQNKVLTVCPPGGS